MKRYAGPIMTAQQLRPRVVSAGFWCWAAGAVLLVAFGLLLAFSPDALPSLFRGMGALLAASGLGLGFLAGRARLGDERRTCVAGDVGVIPGGVEHEAWFPEDTEVVDVFAPRREDFLVTEVPEYMRRG